MSEKIADLLDEMAAAMMSTMTKEQITRIAVGYFAAVEAWEVAKYEPEGLKYYHERARAKLTGVE